MSGSGFTNKINETILNGSETVYIHFSRNFEIN